MAKALVIQTAFLGDVVLTTPLFRALADNYNMKTAAVVTPAGAAILGHPAQPVAGLEKTIAYDKRGSDRGLTSFLKLAARLKNEHFDVLLSPHRSYRSAALTLLSRAPARVGFDENALPFAWTQRVPRDRNIHDVERNLSLLEPLGGLPEDFSPKPEVAVTPEGRTGAERIAGEFLSAPLKIGVAPGSVWGTKRWLPERFAEVMEALTDRKGAKFALVGGPDDRASTATVAGLTSAECTDTAGETNVQEMAALISHLDLFITNDSGAMHVAAALEVPVVAIFGPTVPGFGFTPYTDKAKVIEPENPPRCRPCNPHGPRQCPEGHFDCMKNISVKAVVNAALELLKA